MVINLTRVLSSYMLIKVNSHYSTNIQLFQDHWSLILLASIFSPLIQYSNSKTALQIKLWLDSIWMWQTMRIKCLNRERRRCLWRITLSLLSPIMLVNNYIWIWKYNFSINKVPLLTLDKMINQTHVHHDWSLSLMGHNLAWRNSIFDLSKLRVH